MIILRPPHRYETVEVFYEAAPSQQRRYSGESDYGVWWTEEGTRWPHYRVSLVHNSLELYALRLGNEFGWTENGVQVLAVFEDREEAERVLQDWAEHCGLGGLSWLRERLRIAAGASR